MRPRLLDLYCCEGGCAMGYHNAGYDVFGVDHVSQPRYPFEFVKADAMMFLKNLINDRGYPEENGGIDLNDFSVIHASPPCQVFSAAARIGNAKPGHQDLIAATRRLLMMTGKPWVIENVPGAPLECPIELCGTQFGMRVRRHRLFESSEFLFSPSEPCIHRDGDVTVFGHAVQLCGSRGTAYKDAAGRTHYRQKRMRLEHGREALGCHWMSRAGLSQAIPPAYTEFIGKQLIKLV